jgi:hypothetical protein
MQPPVDPRSVLVEWASPGGLMRPQAARWRVVSDTLQWMLQHWKPGGEWKTRSYCVTREGLLRCVREYGAADPEAQTKLDAFPEWHPDRQ